MRFVPLLLALPFTLRAQGAPCGSPWGSATVERLDSLLWAAPALVASRAVSAAVESRGREAGCPTAVSRTPPDTRPLTRGWAQSLWRGTHAPHATTYDAGCPAIGRLGPARALGIYAAIRSGERMDRTGLRALAHAMGATLYGPETVSGARPYPAGSVGYLVVDPSDPCALRGAPATVAAAACQHLDGACPLYTGGPYAGRRFAVADWSPTWFNGGMAYDHPMTTELFTQCATLDPEAGERAQCAHWAQQAGQWALREPASHNANYTARLVWDLAVLYRWSGNRRYRDRMTDLLDRALRPSLLLDTNGDGLVDGTTLPFRDLRPPANRPGRAWDGHNALDAYTALIAHGLVEAYTAYRDRGDRRLAERTGAMARAVLDNLSGSLVTTGLPGVGGSSADDMPPGILRGIQEFVVHDGESHPTWLRAAWALGQAGTADRWGLQTWNAGLYLETLTGLAAPRAR